MTPNDERNLHDTNRYSWIAYVAPSMAASLKKMDACGIGRTWPMMPRDYQKAVWCLLDEATRERVKSVRNDRG